MKFSINGRFFLDVSRKESRWLAYRAGQGTKRLEADFAIPLGFEPNEVKGYLEDIYHEYALPGQVIRMLGEYQGI